MNFKFYSLILVTLLCTFQTVFGAAGAGNGASVTEEGDDDESIARTSSLAITIINLTNTNIAYQVSINRNHLLPYGDYKSEVRELKPRNATTYYTTIPIESGDEIIIRLQSQLPDQALFEAKNTRTRISELNGVRQQIAKIEQAFVIVDHNETGRHLIETPCCYDLIPVTLPQSTRRLLMERILVLTANLVETGTLSTDAPESEFQAKLAQIITACLEKTVAETN
jgi:hypothetical protein